VCVRENEGEEPVTQGVKPNVGGQDGGLRDEVYDVVCTIIRDILGQPRRNIARDEYLIDNLRMDADDLSFEFVPAVENHFSIEISAEDWRRVHTVWDVVCTVKEYLGRERGGRTDR
jgi:acyl carrier protein